MASEVPPPPHALVHTQGVVLKRRYLPLELAYADVLGNRAHFLITSPATYWQMRRYDAHARPDVTVSPTEGTPYAHVLQFLRSRHEVLRQRVGPVVFGHKGGSFQTQVLRDAGVSLTLDLDTLGMPRLDRTRPFSCPWHPITTSPKCAQAAVDELLEFLAQVGP